MINAKHELLEFLESVGNPKIICAYIDPSFAFYGKNMKRRKYGERIVLRVDYSKQEYKKFLQLLNFEYDNGYGSMEITGTVWCHDSNLAVPSTWLTRDEYDGSEWWVYNTLPKIPKECNREQSLDGVA